MLINYHRYWDSSAVDVGNGRLAWKGREERCVVVCVRVTVSGECGCRTREGMVQVE